MARLRVSPLSNWEVGMARSGCGRARVGGWACARCLNLEQRTAMMATTKFTRRRGPFGEHFTCGHPRDARRAAPEAAVAAQPGRF